MADAVIKGKTEVETIKKRRSQYGASLFEAYLVP